MPILILAALILVPILIFVVIYNGLISKKNNVEYAFSSIDVMLKKRRDLIPNLIESVKQYMQHESGLLTKITELRNSVMKAPDGSSERFDLENKLGSALGQVKVAVENYPDLKANTNFLQLQAALNEVEEQISASRRAFNASVFEYNNGVEMFPSNLVAKMLGYQRKASFEITEGERENVNVGEMFKK
jgi:LemA protein